MSLAFAAESGADATVVGIQACEGVVGNVRRYWQPTFVIDATQTVIDGRTYDGYIVGHACFPGMSGGPVAHGSARAARAS